MTDQLSPVVDKALQQALVDLTDLSLLGKQRTGISRDPASARSTSSSTRSSRRSASARTTSPSASPPSAAPLTGALPPSPPRPVSSRSRPGCSRSTTSTAVRGTPHGSFRPDQGDPRCSRRSRSPDQRPSHRHRQGAGEAGLDASLGLARLRALLPRRPAGIRLAEQWCHAVLRGGRTRGRCIRAFEYAKGRNR